MPPRVDTWFFSVHNFVKRHNLRHWLTVAEARKLLKGEKLGIDAANNCFSRPEDETPLDVDAQMKMLGRLIFAGLSLGAVPVVVVDPEHAHVGSLKAYGNAQPALSDPARWQPRSPFLHREAGGSDYCTFLRRTVEVCREARVPCVELSRNGAEADAAIANLVERGLLRAAFVKDAVRRRVRVYVQHCFSGREWCQPPRHRADEVHLIG